jgi:methylase of polypeptide subunit release factors
MMDGKLHLAPIEEMKGGLNNVLDIGTGTGIWVIDFGMNFILDIISFQIFCESTDA